jgi:hypothetical protein
MTTDITRFEANERVDLSDFLFLADTSLRSQSRHWADQFFRDPARDGPSWILGGFDITYLGAQLTVTLGRAILGHREIGDVLYGSLTTEGAVERVVDVSTFANGTYGVYIRFELIDGTSASRAFWDPAGDGSEFAQTIATRRLADWSVRVELLTSGSPGAEWLKIGEAVISGGAVTGVTEQRDFFFEGEEHNSYASQWSSDGSGDANDRNADRATYGVQSLHTFTAAMRQCLEDIKGRGLRRWWSRDIGGMNIGFDADPVEDRLALGDANFYLDWQDANNVFLHWDGADGYFKYDRVTPQLQLWVDATLAFRADDTGIRARGIAVRGNTGDAPVVDQISCGFPSFKMEYDSGTGDSYLRFDGTQTYMHWDDSASELITKTAGGTPMKSVINGVLVRGLVVDNSLGLAMETNAIKIGDANFKLDWDGTDPWIYLDSGDYLRYDRSAATDGQLNLQIGTAAFHVNKDDARLPNKLSLTASDEFYFYWDGADAFIYFNAETYPPYLKYDNSANKLEYYSPSNVLAHAWGHTGYMVGTVSAASTAFSNRGDYGFLMFSGCWAIRGPDNVGGDVFEAKALHALLYTERADDAVVPAGLTGNLAGCTINAGYQSNSKIYRVTAWGTAIDAGSGTTVDLELYIRDDDTNYIVASEQFSPGTVSSYGSRARWRIEAEISIGTAADSSNNIRTNSLFYYAASGSVAPWMRHRIGKSSGNMDIISDDLDIDLTATIGAAGNCTLEVGEFIVEEMGGQDNAS